MWYSSGEFNHNKVTMSQIYESLSLHCSNSMCDAKLSNKFFVTTDVRQPWTNYVNNGNKHLILGEDVRSEYSNIRYLYLIIGKVQKFVSGDKYDF